MAYLFEKINALGKRVLQALTADDLPDNVAYPVISDIIPRTIHIDKVLYDCRNPAHIVFDGTYMFAIESDNNYIHRKSTSWSNYTTSMTSIGAVCARSNGTIVLGLYSNSTQRRRSTDNGATWADVTNSTALATAAGSVNNSSGTMIMTYYNNGSGTNLITRSTDNGATWSDINVGASGEYHAITNNNAGSWLIIGNGVARKSTDDGATWSAATLPAFNNTILNCSFTNNLFFIAEEQKIAWSSDLSTWNSAPSAVIFNLLSGSYGSSVSDVFYVSTSSDNRYCIAIGYTIFSFKIISGSVQDWRTEALLPVIAIPRTRIVYHNSKYYFLSGRGGILEFNPS